VRNELGELLKAAIYKENASEAFYIAAQHKTDDPAAIRLMKELADEEHRHSQMLKELQERDWKDNQWRREEMPTLIILPVSLLELFQHLRVSMLLICQFFHQPYCRRIV